jgi:hypothetical protein
MVRRVLRSLRSFWTDAPPVARIAYCVGALLFASGLAHLAVLIATGGAWQGPRSLRKPATFGLSFGLTLITIVWVASFIRLGRAARIVLLGMFMVGCVLETALISMQAWRGVPSHFNVETPFDASVTGFLAGGGVILVVVILTLTITAFRSNPRVPVSLTMGVRIGLLTLCASLTVGALMIAKGMTLARGGNPEAAYATGGALKPTHGALMHGVLLLPLFAWLLTFTDWSERRRLVVVSIASCAYVGIAAAVAVGNLAGLW